MPQKQTKKKKVNQKNGLKLFLFFVVVTLLTFGVLSIMRYLSDEKRRIDNETSTAPLQQDDGDKPVEAQKDAGYEAKEKAEKEAAEENNHGTTEDGKIIADVIITSAGVLNDKVLVSGMVSNIIEADGICNYIFTNGDTTIVEDTPGMANAKNTVCSSVSLDKSVFQAGNWNVVLKYSSTKAEGQSEASTVEVR